MTGQELSIAQVLSHARERGLAPLDAEVLVARALGRPRSWLRAWAEHPCTRAEFDACDALISRRAEGEPIAYILGEREFWSLPLRVDERTLIPRPDTETLVQRALSLRDAIDRWAVPAARVLDLGTGSGAIALALASESPHWQLTATDINHDTLRLARVNAERLGLSLRLRHGHWWQALESDERFQLIASNPPYLTRDDPHLREGDLRFEPRVALISGEDGLDAMREIVRGARSHLREGGWLIVEHGYQQGPVVRELFTAAGYAEIDTGLDLSGHERVTQGRSPGLRPPPGLQQ
ncbi:MAG: peptide chain release factor N(5)-glutamine methyltransferase [Pseudomonadota bacterium]